MTEKYVSKYNIFNFTIQPDRELHMAHPHLPQDQTVDVTKYEGIYENSDFIIYNLNSPSDGEVFYCNKCSPKSTCIQSKRDIIKPLPIDTTCVHLKFIRSDPELVI
jgi:hypothetical protein